MKSVNERRELKQYGGELVSFAPTPSSKFGLSDEHIRQAHITAEVETSDAGSRVTGTRMVTMGVFALAAKKKKSDAVTVILRGDDGYAQVLECSGPRIRNAAEQFASRVNSLGSVEKVAGITHGRSEGASKLDQLTQLGQLRDQGVLTDEEFQAEKANVLA